MQRWAKKGVKRLFFACDEKFVFGTNAKETIPYKYYSKLFWGRGSYGALGIMFNEDIEEEFPH